MTGRGLPFIGFSDEERKNIEYVISDVDDTITKNGKLYPLVLDAMYRLKMSGRTIVLVTGDRLQQPGVGGAAGCGVPASRQPACT